MSLSGSSFRRKVGLFLFLRAGPGRSGSFPCSWIPWEENNRSGSPYFQKSRLGGPEGFQALLLVFVLFGHHGYSGAALGGLFYGRALRGKRLSEALLPSFLRAAKKASMAGRRGALIVLEGVDRAGKSTQGRRLVEALRAEGHQAELLRFPERATEIGRLISSYLEKKTNLEDHTVHLLFSANRWEQVPLIKEKLNQGVTLVVDRYAFSGVAFTSAKEKFSFEWCKQPDVGLPKPDLIFFLQLSTSEAAKRGDFGNERYENSPFQEKVLQCFYHLIKDKTLNWKIIDASKNIEDLHNEIKSFAQEAMQEAEHTPIGELWK